MIEKEIYLVETSAGQKDIPKDWTKNGGTKVSSSAHPTF